MQKIDEQLHRQVDSWIEKRSKGLIYPVYASFDLRVSQHKAAVVDANLFPAGFNNLCDSMIESGSAAFSDYIQNNFPHTKTIAVFSEAHTRNDFYFLNLQALGKLITLAGFECVFVHPAFEGERDGLHFSLANLSRADLIISNNDFSGGYPLLLEALKVPVIPNRQLIWDIRRKSHHFSIHNKLAQELAAVINLDPWLFSTEFEVEKHVNLRDADSLSRIKLKASALFSKLRQKHHDYNIDRAPTLFIKDDAGTYGMGIMTITDIDELDHLNRKTTNKMLVGKQHVIKDLLIQEGIPSHIQHKGAVAEPVIYSIANTFIGSFLRVNPLRDELANLNAKGMEFFRICDQHKDPDQLPAECTNLDIITDAARIAIKLSLLATAIENSQTVLSPTSIEIKKTADILA